MSKRIVIPRDRLPEINSFTKSYAVRFRLITEDRNKLSYWSPIFSIPSNLLYDFNSNNISIVRDGSRYTVSWEAVVIKTETNILETLREYDLWVQWSKGEFNAEWIYRERITGNTTSLFAPSEYYLVNPTTKERVLIEDQPDRVSVEVYIPGNPPIREDSVYEEEE
jgi:hypothetical protein